GGGAALTRARCRAVLPVLALAVLTVLTGLAVYLGWDRVNAALRGMPFIDRYGPARGYDAWLSGLTSLAHGTTVAFQHGSLRGYIRLLFIVAASALLVPLTLRSGLAMPHFSLNLIDIRYLAFAGAIVGAVAAAMAPTAFGAVIATGLVGFATALIFMLFGAPDVAFTQFSVETLMVVILATTPTRLPLPPRAHRGSRRTATGATIASLGRTALTPTRLATPAAPPARRLSPWFGENSMRTAHGRHGVNVSLVNFRAPAAL